MVEARNVKVISAEELTASSSEGNNVWRIGDLIVDVVARTVFRGSVPLSVKGLSFDLLVGLIQAAPETISQDELIEAVWTRRTVSSETVNKRVELLRQALGDDASDPRYIGLVWGRGYKLLLNAEPLQQNTKHVAARSHRALIAWNLGLAALILAAVFSFWNREQPPSSADSTTRPGIAVLPFSAQGIEAQEAEFLAAGIHDDIITALAQIQDLLVISRTSVLAYRDKQLPVTEISKTLNVDKVLEGHLQRTSDKIKLNVQLIDATSDRHIWAKTYENDLSVANVLAVQRQIASDVAAAVNVQLGHPVIRLVNSPTDNMRAYDHYLAARQLVQRNLAPGASFSEIQQALAAASRKVRAALSEDPEFGEAYALQSTIECGKYHVALKKLQARRDALTTALLKAVALAPDNPLVHRALGCYYFIIGKPGESTNEIERAARGAPQETDILVDLGLRYFMDGKTEEAREVMKRAVAQDPLHHRALAALTAIEFFSGNHASVLALNRRAQSLRPDDPSLVYQEAGARYMLSADLVAYREAVEELPIGDTRSVQEHWTVAFLSRDYARALAVLRANPFDSIRGPGGGLTPYTFLTGLTLLMAGDRDGAIVEFQAARAALEAVRDPETPDPRVLSLLAQVLAGLGEHELAREAVQQTLNSDQYKQNRILASTWRWNLAGALVLNSDFDDAVELLESHFGLFGYEHCLPCFDSPLMDPLRADPRFLELKNRFTNASAHAKSGDPAGNTL